MCPVRVTPEAERDNDKKSLCDQVIYRAAVMMTGEFQAPMPMMLDRMLTYVAAQACAADGSAKTAAAFRELASKIERGLFHSIAGENEKSEKRH